MWHDVFQQFGGNFSLYFLEHLEHFCAYLPLSKAPSTDTLVFDIIPHISSALFSYTLFSLCGLIWVLSIEMSLILWSFFFFFLRATLWQARGGLGAAAHTTATAKPDRSCVCHLHSSLQQPQIHNALSKARDQTHILTETIASS